jgi:hypothetical protein
MRFASLTATLALCGLGIAAASCAESIANRATSSDDCDDPNSDNYDSNCGTGGGSVGDSYTAHSPLEARARPAHNAHGARAKRETSDGKTQLSLDVVLDDDSTLRMSASPGATGESVAIKLVHFGDLSSCTLSWLVDGNREDDLNTKFTNKKLSTAKLSVNRLRLEDMGVSHSIALKACETRWSFDDQEMAELQKFVAMYNEELAWSGPGHKGGTGGRVAPAGGWPEWTFSGSAPKAKGGAKFEAAELFDLLAPSVVLIEALASGKGGLQGSAVAVSETELLTNCHVVEGARKIIAKQDKKEWVATLVRSDPATDRCVLSVTNTKLKPVPGVRSYKDLKVGEALYTLGSPKGLELSISNGILSGLREEEGRQWVQTTAPISHGSSGGGLFDARGNIVGITTWTLDGLEKGDQALNFAIPAESFWQK